MISATINLRPLDQSQKRSMDHIKGDHFEEATENSFGFSFYLEKSVRPETGLFAHNKRSGGTGVTGTAGRRLS